MSDKIWQTELLQKNGMQQFNLLPMFLPGASGACFDSSNAHATCNSFFVRVARRNRVRASTKKKTQRASVRKHCASSLRAPQAFERVLCATGGFVQAKVFHELNPPKIELLQYLFAFYSVSTSAVSIPALLNSLGLTFRVPRERVKFHCSDSVHSHRRRRSELFATASMTWWMLSGHTPSRLPDSPRIAIWSLSYFPQVVGALVVVFLPSFPHAASYLSRHRDKGRR